ncbi:MAG: hypothetical protein K9M49_00200 [Candidatus Marinimicrobia bacterium]|nr:hypothetical protein [Candidatus Neomarinimicrobiota bacterium]MCF7903547.1 hypothetical protein [Candidatus Neomarinimicrobiota bacterium]
MKQKLWQFLLLVTTTSMLTSCISFSTLQSADTLDAGQMSLSAGASVLGADEDNAGLLPEVGLRLGVNDRVDVGAKLFMPLALFVDAKVELIQKPVIVSLDVGYSTFTLTSGAGETKHRTVGLYPMLIAGQKHWYVGVKPMFVRSEGEIDLLGSTSSQDVTALLATDVVFGAVIGNRFRFIPEVNILFPASDDPPIMIPGLGFELKLGPK